MSVHDAGEFKRYITEYFGKHSIEINFADGTTETTTNITFNLHVRQENLDEVLISFTYEIPDNKLHACTLRIEIKETTIVEAIEDYDELHSLLDKECGEFLHTHDVTSQSPIVKELYKVNKKFDRLLEMIAKMKE